MSAHRHKQTGSLPTGPDAASPGILLHGPRRYDAQVWLATRGRERALRETILRVSRLTAGEAVLDVGCGTGTMAIAAKQGVGATGQVFAVDASPEMVAAARDKARKAGVEIKVEEAFLQALPFPDARFDLVTSTFMLHHLPPPAREAGVREIARVLKPGGRALVVDFATSSRAQGGIFHRLHHHGRVRPIEIVGLLEDAGLTVLESERLAIRDLHYVLAAASETSA